MLSELSANRTKSLEAVPLQEMMEVCFWKRQLHRSILKGLEPLEETPLQYTANSSNEQPADHTESAHLEVTINTRS